MSKTTGNHKTGSEGEKSRGWPKKFIVTGVTMRNKGSQAMFFSVITGLRRRFPFCSIVDFSLSDYMLSKEEKESYNFSILPWMFNLQFIILFRMQKLPILCKYLDKRGLWKRNGNDILAALRECDGIVDAGGYKLGSRWSGLNNLAYLMNMMIAARFRKPMWLMPQSFGPWKWTSAWRFVLPRLMKSYLPRMEQIFAREPDGYELLRPFTSRDNLHYSPDMVVRESVFCDPAMIYINPPSIQLPKISTNSVALVLNEHMYTRGNAREVSSTYARIARLLLSKGMNVYLVRSSSVDYKLCQDLIIEIGEHEKLVFMNEDYSCLEIERMMGQFEFVISSRYHSVIFAYRNGVPVVMLGWSEKYLRVAELVGQEKYVVDLSGWDEEKIISNVLMMLEQYREERKTIIEKLRIVQRSSVFDEAFAKYSFASR